MKEKLGAYVFHCASQMLDSPDCMEEEKVYQRVCHFKQCVLSFQIAHLLIKRHTFLSNNVFFRFEWHVCRFKRCILSFRIAHLLFEWRSFLLNDVFFASNDMFIFDAGTQWT